MTTLPELTPEQRTEALAKAAFSRRERARVKGQLKAKVLTLDEVLAMSETNDAIAKMKVVDLLKSMPQIGEKKAVSLMEQFGIAPSRRLRGLGPHQHAALSDRFASIV